MDSVDSLKYTDETDKSFGLAGMAISLMAWDAEDWLESINIDAKPDEAMHMSAEFYLNIAPRVGAKALWEQSLKRFHLTTAMTLANWICREMAYRRHSSLSSEDDKALRSALTDEGASLCGLDDDEILSIYNQSLSYCKRLFGHTTINSLAQNLSDALCRERKLSASDVWSILAPLKRM